MTAAWILGVALGAAAAEGDGHSELAAVPMLPRDERRIAVVLDASRSRGPDGWADQRHELEVVVRDLDPGHLAVVVYAASAEWLVAPWVGVEEGLAAIPTSQVLGHGSEATTAVSFAVHTETPPTRVVVFTDGLLAGHPDAESVVSELKAVAGDVPVTVVWGLPFDAPHEDSPSDEAAAQAWLEGQLAAAVPLCVTKEKHQQRLPEAIRIETTLQEIVGLDLGETDERWRYCLADALGALSLGPQFDQIEHLSASLALRPEAPAR